MEEEDVEIVPEIRQKPRIQRLPALQNRLSIQNESLLGRQQVVLQKQLRQRGPQTSTRFVQIQRKKPIISERPNILNRISITR